MVPSLRHPRRRAISAGALVGALLLALAPAAREVPRLRLVGPEAVADGVEMYRSTDASTLNEARPGPVSLVAARLDPRKVTLGTALAHGCAPARDTVSGIAAREQAVVAINAGFFSMRGAGAPVGLLKHRGRWIGGTSRARGAVAFPVRAPGAPARLVFGRVAVGARLVISSRWQSARVRVDRLSPEPGSAGLSFYGAPCVVPDEGRALTRNTGVRSIEGPAPSGLSAPPQVGVGRGREGPASSGLPASGSVVPADPAHPADSDGPGSSTRSWPLRQAGVKWEVRSAAPDDRADTRADAWLVHRGATLPAALARLQPGASLRVEATIAAEAARAWQEAPDAVGGAGLLVSHGKAVTDWTPEKTADGFRADRHPRTLVGVGHDGSIWLIAIDGRNPALSVGMSFAELQRTALALGLRDALNLDGGGSTTLVVRGEVVNRPSDPTGPRQVSDAIVVRLRPAAGGA